MGHNQSLLTKTQMKDLQGITKAKRKSSGKFHTIVSPDDIKSYYKFWYELYPSGEMTKDGFKKFANIAMPEAPPDSDVDYLFRAMDQNKDGTITFKEFLVFQSVTAPSQKPIEPEDFIEMAFTMYDEDNDGYITENEMLESLTNMFKARNIEVKSVEVKKTITTRITTLLKIADQNGDKRLTKDEILGACKKDPSLLVMF